MTALEERAPQDALVVIWQVDLDDARWDGWAWVLSDAERSKATTFRKPVAQARWRRGRSALRCVLATHTGQAPAALVLLAERFGKPALAGTPLHFNVSHTERWALVAVAPAPVGIDVEWLGRKEVAVADIAAVACHPAETAALLALPREAGNAALLRLWTQKEAYVKALGTGLQHALTAVRMEGADVTGRTAVIDEGTGTPDRHFVHAVAAPAGCVASLCMAAPDIAVLTRKASLFLGADPADAEQTSWVRIQPGALGTLLEPVRPTGT